MTSKDERAQDRRNVRIYKAETPDVLQRWAEFNAAVFSPEQREIPLKYLELIALGVALTTQCAYCIESHSHNAVAAGASDAELAEAAWVSAALRAGGAYTHGLLAFSATRPAEGQPAHAH
ncbi:carboxymuconolactone decarboxylase family protein [Microbacterium sp.]|uniref:carboxymuconolactone decarboxylase family protein n=1 Tax=Microbacterium sp. TaxID=51671 RepID=UPI0039E3A0BB